MHHVLTLYCVVWLVTASLIDKPTAPYSNQCFTLSAPPTALKNSGIQWTGSWVEPIATVDDVEKKEVLYFLESNPHRSPIRYTD
jgi:hypothetical protein